MANHSLKETEILVHITAPSKAADDVVYRQLAQAYLDFAPQTRTNLVLTEPAQSEGDKQTQEEIVVATDFVTSTPQEVFEINSQDISFQSALDNRTSPRLRWTGAKQVVIPSSQETGLASQTSWCAPPSQISDSYPMPEPGLLTVSPSRVLRHYIGRSSGVEALRSSPLSPSPTRKRNAQPLSNLEVPSSVPDSQEDEPVVSKAHLSIGKRPLVPFTPSAINGTVKSPRKTRELLRSPQHITTNTGGTPTIPFTAQITGGVIKSPKANRETLHVEQGETERLGNIPLDITHISSSVGSEISSARSPRAESEPPPAKRLRATQVQHADLVRSISDTGPIIVSSHPLDEIHNSLEIRPPSPPVGISIMNPEDMISEKFAKLARDLHGRYRPESKRTIDPFERGYWLLDCKTWDLESRRRMWVFLNNYLHRQLAGWGTWCRRDENYEWIRLYCWGHVVEHTYLLLYVSSERYLKRTSAAWYDAGGELVIEVPPAHEKR